MYFKYSSIQKKNYNNFVFCYNPNKRYASNHQFKSIQKIDFFILVFYINDMAYIHKKIDII